MNEDYLGRTSCAFHPQSAHSRSILLRMNRTAGCGCIVGRPGDMPTNLPDPKEYKRLMPTNHYSDITYGTISY